MSNQIIELLNNIFIFDLIFIFLTILSLIKCTSKGFVLSLLSASKWLLAYILTLFLFPKIKPYVDGIIDNKYIFHDTDIVIDRNLLIGHSHQQFFVTKGEFKIINPGSLGQNRKYINQAAYAVYYNETDTFELKNFIFDLDIVISEMKNKKYPQICIDYYMNKEQVI